MGSRRNPGGGKVGPNGVRWGSDGGKANLGGSLMRSGYSGLVRSDGKVGRICRKINSNCATGPREGDIIASRYG